MRTVRRNKTVMSYSLYVGSTLIYERDADGAIQFHMDSDGNRYPLDTGEKEDVYGEAREMSANISMSGGDAVATEYGLTTADYSAVLITDRDAYPLKEGSLIWVTSPVVYKYNGAEVVATTPDKKTVNTKAADMTSADYRVVKKSDSLNYTRWILAAINK